MRKKIKDNGGFTMVEMLCAVAILVLLCLIISTCLGMALRSYRDITAKSETQLLLNDLSDALSDRLRYAIVTEKTNAADGSIISTECSVSGFKVVDGKVIQDWGDPLKDKALLSVGAYGKLLNGNSRYEVDATSFVCNRDDDADTTPVFTVKMKVKDTLGPVSADTTLIVRCLNPVKKEVVY